MKNSKRHKADVTTEAFLDYLADLCNDLAKSGESNEQIAARAKVDTTTVWRWRQKATMPQLDKMIAAIELLGGDIMIPAQRSGGSELAIIITELQADEELKAALVAVLQAGPEVRKKFLDDAKFLGSLSKPA